MNSKRHVRCFPNPKIIHAVELLTNFLAWRERNRAHFLCKPHSVIDEQNLVLAIRKGVHFFEQETWYSYTISTESTVTAPISIVAPSICRPRAEMRFSLMTALQ
ncbi:hypothetical protein PoB_005343500 [Plakobranchus ocellatus]|uniref:Uncharacterized protein n=1 Tax=Plakobranchus ocellatus TaxID=259542 RepID=A0AAV4C5I8_9GAST|nr:hypothetical protein PoB_005343500 [Plakobranchus ocellatus]